MHYESPLALQYRPALLFGVAWPCCLKFSRCEPPACGRKWHPGYGDAVEGAEPASLKARIMLRTSWFGKSIVLSSVAPVFGEVSLVRSHSVMAARS